MKIINQSENQLSLKDGNISGIIIGAALVIVGSFAIFISYLASGLSSATWFTSIFLLTGLVVIFVSAAILITIDKTQNQIIFLKKRLIGGKTQIYNIQDVLRVELRRSNSLQSGTRGQQVLQHQSVIVLKDGTEVPLENVKSSSNNGIGSIVLMGGMGKELSISNQIANFLGVPFQEIGPGAAPTIPGINIGGMKIGL